VERNGSALFRDDHHLSASGARMILTPFLRQYFLPELSSPGRYADRENKSH
jgi:hypothetical protein